MNMTNVTYGLLPEYTTTAKGRPRKPIKEVEALLSVAIERGATIRLDDPETQEALQSRGVPMSRLPNAVHSLRKYYGITVTATREGRRVVSYTIGV
jgi:hypothetical protein